MKQGIRILGIDDAAFEYEQDSTLLTGVVYRGTEFIEDIKKVDIDVDGYDADNQVVRLFRKCNNTKQIKAVLTDGICFAGFNFLDLDGIADRIDRPVIAVTSNKPDRQRFIRAMKKSNNYDERIEEMAEPEEIQLKDGKVYIQFSNCSKKEAEEIVRSSVIHGLTPEPIRVADMIGNNLR